MAEHIDVDGHGGSHRKAFQEVAHILGGELPDTALPKSKLDRRVGAPGKIDNRPREGLVEGSIGMAETNRRSAPRERDRQALSKNEGTILSTMMIVYLKVAVAAEGQGKASVPRQGTHQVVEEADARRDRHSAATATNSASASAAIEVQVEDYLRFPRLPPEYGPTARLAPGLARCPSQILAFLSHANSFKAYHDCLRV